MVTGGWKTLGGGRPLLLAGVLLLSACATREAEEARSAQQLLVGMPVQTLLSCAGVPDRREAVDAAEYFTYSSLGRAASSSGSSVGLGVGGGSGGGGHLGVGLGIGIPLGGSRDASGCVATFTVRQSRVEQLTYRGGSDDPAACYAIVENCLALVPGRQ